MLTPRQIIEDIRRKQYGIGLPTDAESSPVIASMRKKLDRALKLLSTDLYAKDIHFVLELLQNAEDNSYAPGVVPEIRFVLTSDAILVQNNEVGFSEDNVRSICDVANSSKKKRLGYIGEKGIGFKSVFRVTDEPLIVSNGFSFSLPIHDQETNLGYVIPVWREDIPAGLDPSFTNIYLPLTSKGISELPRVADIHSNLLLFLKKVRKIDVCDATGTPTKSIHREEAGGRISIRSNDGIDHWRIVSQTLSVPPTIIDEKREGVSTVELVIAFPLTEEGTPDTSSERPIYSFLPIRSYGFRFAIQGDFILASSREDILTDRAWNQWLRDGISSLFLEAVESFKADDCLRTTFLSFVPSSTEVTDAFFNAIPANIIELLKKTECILTASGRWAKPSEVLIASRPVRDLLTNDDVKTHVHKELIDEDFQADSKVLQLLEVPTFAFNDLVACLGDTKWVLTKGDAWLLRMFAYLNTWNWTDKGLRVVRSMNLVPLENGGLESPAAGQIFFPLAKRTTYGFEEGLRIVKKELFKAPDDAIKAADDPIVEPARKFLRGSLGVRSADPLEIINEHILPVFEASDEKTNWKSKSTGFKLGAVEYIKDHLELFEKAGGSLDRLKRGLWIKFAHPEGRWYHKTIEVYLPKAYGNTNDLEGLFQGIDGIRFVDEAYLELSISRQQKKAKDGKISAKQKHDFADSWRAFFTTLGVEAAIRVTYPADADDPDQVASPHLAKLISTGDTERIAKALRLLDAHWSRYRRCLEVELYYGQRNRGVSYGKAPTAFRKLLRDSDWIPTKEHGLCTPSKVFVDVEANRSLLGDNVPYLAVNLTNEDFIKDISIQTNPTVANVLSCLAGLVDEQVEEVDHFRRLYRFLDENYELGAVAISSAFESQPLIYIPGRPGQFQKRTEVFWKDVSWLFGDTRGYLSKPWKALKRFFVNRLEVALTPSPQDYVDLLKELSLKSPVQDGDEPKIWEVYRELERRLSDGETDDDPTESSWWLDFASSGLFWSDRNEFRKSRDDIYVNDHVEYYDLFNDHDDCAFLKLPENQFPSFRYLIRASGLHKLSDAVRVVETLPLHPRQETDATRVVRQAAPFIVRYLYFKENDIYRELEASGTLKQMGDVNVSICDDLDVVLEFRGSRERVARDVAGEFPQLFVREGVDDLLDQIGVSLAKLFQNPRGLGSFICHLLTKKSRAAMEKLMEAYEIAAMPTHVPLSSLFPPTEEDDYSQDELFDEQGGTDAVIEEGHFDEADGLQEEERSGQIAHDRPSIQAGASVRSDSSGTSVTEWNAADEDNDGARGDRLESENANEREQDRQTPSHRAFCGEQGGRRGQNGDQEEESRGNGDRQSSKDTSSRERQKSADHQHGEQPAKNWFRVLARPAEAAESSGHGDPPPSDDVARQKVVEYEVRRERPATKGTGNQEGYDVSSEDRHRGVKRLIEVKGLQQRWTGDATVTLTGPQFDAARLEPPPGCEYWLYVVDGLGTNSPRVHPIFRFAAKVERVYLQAQDWLPEVDQADRDRLTADLVERLDLPIVDFGSLVEKSPETAFLTRYSQNDLSDLVPVGGFLKCIPLNASTPLPAKGQLVMLLPRQVEGPDPLSRPLVGEFRWSVRQSLEGEPQFVEVSLRPKTANPDAKSTTIRIPMSNWSTFRPYAICEPLVDT